jgi:hypothetical protein
MNRNGVAWSALTWMIIGVLFLIVVLIVIGLSSGKMGSLTDAAKTLLRFGG